jgi:hypothetical protein
MGINLKDLPHHVQARIIKDNPGVLRQVETKKPQPTAPQTLDSQRQKFKAGQGGLVARITLITLRRRLLDDDNGVGSLKPLRDAIANTLGFDDGSPLIQFEYGQQKTDGEEGVVVKIEL